jgi:hypothetical protein
VFLIIKLIRTLVAMKIVNKRLTASLRFLLSLALLGTISNSFAADDKHGLWQDVELHASSTMLKKSPQPAFNNARLMQLDVQSMRDSLTTSDEDNVAARGFALSRSTKMLSLPLPDGRYVTVKAQVSRVLPKALADKFPQIKTYKLIPDEQIISGRVDMTPQGFHGMLQLRSGETIFIDPVSSPGDAQEAFAKHAVYRKNDQPMHQTEKHQCLLSDHESDHENNGLLTSSPVSSSKVVLQRSGERSTQQLLNYRIAIAATGEYTALKGGKVAALSAIATTLNRVNQVYEQDLGIHLTLVENNDDIIFSDASSDPYNGDTQDMLVQNQQVIDRFIGTNNYDIGHLFATRGGGLARIGSVCKAGSKAQGVSGTSNPGDDVFNLDFVAHEIGHQLGATHTFNSSQGLCSGRTRTGSTAYEPGSGSTIMSYAGICGSDNLQSHADGMFHIGSIEQIGRFTQHGIGSSCGTRSEIGNTSPRPHAGKDYVIPANTPFELRGTASDAEGDNLVYAWEQVDAGSSSSAYEDKGNNALFRAHVPNQSSTRIFPPLENILYHKLEKGENLPVKERLLRFKFVAQDGYNAAQSDEMQIQVKRTGSRFALDLPRAHYTLGTDHRISWNVANTNRAPINCDNVDVSISTDGGYNYEMLEEGIANTGEAWIYLPATLEETSQARFKLSCSNNIFFAISYRDFSLTFDDLDEAPELGPEPGLRDRSTSAVPPGTSSGSSAGQSGNGLA